MPADAARLPGLGPANASRFGMMGAVAAMVMVMACCLSRYLEIVDHPGASKRILDVHTLVLSEKLSWADACANACSQGVDAVDLDLHQRYTEEVRGSYSGSEESEIDVCVRRCLGVSEAGGKEKHEVGYVAHPHSLKPSRMLRDYFECAIGCTPPVRIQAGHHSNALQRLSSCGVVHLENVWTNEFLSQLQKAAALLRNGSFNGVEVGVMLNTKHLRGGREELWLPFVTPFSDILLSASPSLMQLLDEYFSRHYQGRHQTMLQAMNVIISKHGFTEDQSLHSDVKHAGRHLEVHIPLQDVSLKMGPTRLCPCTHGNDILHTVLLAEGGGNLSCADYRNTHYEAVSSFGDVTIYDAAMLHKGLANRAEVDRPVLVMSFAASVQEAESRDYSGHLTSISREGTGEVSVASLPVAALEMQKFKRFFSEGTSAEAVVNAGTLQIALQIACSQACATATDPEDARTLKLMDKSAESVRDMTVIHLCYVRCSNQLKQNSEVAYVNKKEAAHLLSLERI